MINITINANDLKNLIDQVKPTLMNVKGSHECLKKAHLVITGNVLSLTSFNLIAETTGKMILDEPISADIDCLIDVLTLSKLIKHLEDDIKLQFNLNDITLTNKKVKANLPILPADEFPKFEMSASLKEPREFDIEKVQSAFRTVSSICANATNPTLAVVNVVKSDLGSILYATDSHRLIKAKLEVVLFDSDSVLMPYEVIANILTIFKGYEGITVREELDGNIIEVATESIVYRSRLAQSNFPQCEVFFSSVKGFEYCLSADELKEGLDTVTSVSSDSTKIVEFKFEEDSLILSFNSEYGEAESEIEFGKYGDCEYSDISINLNAGYLDLFLKSTEAPFDITIEAPNKPVLLKSETFEYIVMPIMVRN